MKKLIILLFLGVYAMAWFTQQADKIVGTWWISVGLNPLTAGIARW